ncbi:hypothetical protein [Nocardia sp. NPDC057353]|uniref:hypothetical protein n=1 Tax=Nocardia sp. NPDC057353 TaxID=3346104 RepID=UPI00363BA250
MNDSRLSLWLRVREFAVPAAMIETCTVRRLAGDWAGACAAAGFDLDLDPRALPPPIRTDLRHLAPDLLRWHLPRVAPDGLLRPGLTLTLARYGPVHLVVRTAPAWADAGQRVSIALWDGGAAGAHPHPRPDRRFRLDLHRHLWDARRAGELRMRCGAGDYLDMHAAGVGTVGLRAAAVDAIALRAAGADTLGLSAAGSETADPRASGARNGISWVSEGAGRAADSGEQPLPSGCATERWADEARILLHADALPPGPVLVRVGARRRALVDPYPDAPRPRGALPVLPDAATWTLPDLQLLRAGAITPDRLHPLVANALAPGHTRTTKPDTAQQLLVDCRGEQHRLGMRDGTLTALDHTQAELHREELLVALTGTPLPCLRVIDRAHRNPDALAGVGERLRHGDITGALAVVEGLLGPDTLLRDGPLRAELEAAAERKITHGLYRAGLTPVGPPPRRAQRRVSGAHPRHATHR